MRVAPFVPAITVAIALVAASCANWRFGDDKEAVAEEPLPAVAVAPAPARSNSMAKPEEKPKTPGLVDDGLRLPDLLILPSERDLRRDVPAPESDGTAGVTARPPAPPPPNDE